MPRADPGLTLDAGALLALERDRAPVVRLVAATRLLDRPIGCPAPVVGEVWRGGPRQARLARVLSWLDVAPVGLIECRRAGELLGAAGLTDVVDALVVLHAARGQHEVLTSDPEDIARLARAAGADLEITPV
jgi:predicted nucleic acid-binding protein